MAGLPSSGKTTFVAKLTATINEQLPDTAIEVIDPSADLPPEFDSLDESMQRDYRIAAWSVDLERARSLVVHAPKDTIIIIDTCASKFNPLQPIITDAMLNHHKIAFIFMASSQNECKQRAGSKWIGNEQCARYIDDFKHSIPEFKNVTNFSIVVKNSDAGMDNIDNAVSKLAAYILECAS